MTLTKAFLLLTAASAASFFIADPRDKEGQAVLPQDTTIYKIGVIAGQIKHGFNKGFEGMPPCHEAYLADVRSNRGSCGSVFQETSQIVGYNAGRLMDGINDAEKFADYAERQAQNIPAKPFPVAISRRAMN